ncbi:unnamed protein product [Rotaria sp. Silwood1]|nr:unnamed protein product [Rotaria sp. Silwood1]CAF1627694.1 unnamed protein product [Rotaria sp. Silwood1]CAF3718429.1 unnamed protein product [Rotaria sp. Silwood1]CAF4760504.1 unnamed protein product [Rotaria sp. Silwood1]
MGNVLDKFFFLIIFGYAIPIVQILANGGASSILTVCQALQQGTPVIVIEGTGRAADEIALIYKYLYGNHPVQHEEQRSIAAYNEASSKFQDFARRIRSGFGYNTVLNHTNCDQFIKQITSPEGYFLISIFHFHNEQGEQKLEDAILHALLNGAKIIKNEEKQRITEIKLAMAWNKFDYIRKNILTDKTIFQWTDLELDQALHDSLRMNKIRCTDLLVEYGASFDRLQRFDLLDKLYQEVETNVLTYSKHMIEKIHKKKDLSNLTELDKKYFYEDYLDIDLNDTKNLSLSWVNNSTTKYGTLDDDSVLTNSASNFNHPICVFNAVDMIQANGFLNTISIRFDNSSKPFPVDKLPVCYLISPTNNPNSFLIAFKCQLQSLSNNMKDIFHYKTAEKPPFVTNGQYIAIGFTYETGFPCNVPQRNQHSLDLSRIELILSTAAKTSIQFNVESRQGVAISFNIDSSPVFFRDLFFWSLFFNRYNMATYLCSKSSNATVAALLASKIYHRAAMFNRTPEERLGFVEKAKEFDKHASVIIDMCFDENNEFALDILKKRSPLFFEKYPLEIAKDIESRTFLATKTVQRYLDQQWYGQLNEYDRNKFWIGSLIFIMCCIPILIPIQALSKFIISDKRQPKIWEKKRHIIGWSARIFYRFKEFYSGRAIVFYIIFLALFSYVLLVDYFPININGGQRSTYNNLFIPISEIFLHVLIWSLIFEEGHEFLQHWKVKKYHHSRYSIYNYFSQNKWNILDIFAIIIYLVAFITRFIVIKEVFTASKILMCIDLFLWYIRILHVFAVFEGLGPKLLMIFNTMKDLLFFLYFILIFLVAYSVTSYALIVANYQISWKDANNKPSSRQFQALNNGTGLWNWEILRDIIDWGMWKIYGQIDLDASYHFDNEEKVAVTNDAYGITAFILTIFFVSVANILLLNILVALFNITIQKVQQNAHESWAYYRFLLVTEYTNKTFLPPPLNIFIYIFSPLYHFLKNRHSKKPNNTYGILDSGEMMKIDSNLVDMVVFNGVDRIRRMGLITSVTINFSSPPRIPNPSIILYLLESESNSPNRFRVTDEKRLRTDHIQRRSGVQRIVLNDPLKCFEKQFVALAFETYSGTPASVKDRNEHSVNHAHFCSLKAAGKSIHFMNYPNKGAAFSFIIEQHLKDLNDGNTSEPFNQQVLSMTEASSNSTVTTLNKFEERDNMLRERSIAEDYWKQVIDEIKQQEARVVEEQNNNIN